MNFDIRIPIGAMFSIIGVLLVGYGVFSDAEIYRRSFSLNLNLLWGGVLLLFGGAMWTLGRRGSRRAAREAAGTSPSGEPPEARSPGSPLDVAAAARDVRARTESSSVN